MIFIHDKYTISHFNIKQINKNNNIKRSYHKPISIGAGKNIKALLQPDSAADVTGPD